MRSDLFRAPCATLATESRRPREASGLARWALAAVGVRSGRSAYGSALAGCALAYGSLWFGDAFGLVLRKPRESAVASDGSWCALACGSLRRQWAFGRSLRLRLRSRRRTNPSGTVAARSRREQLT